MSKVYPSEIHVKDGGAVVSETVTAWTVWKKSSMSFVGSDGFSVYDGEGKLAFRVDNYSRRNKFLLGELLLMDAIGRPLLSLRPQILSTHGQWKGYRGDVGSNSTAKSITHLFTMRRRSLVKNNDGNVEVFMRGASAASVHMAADFRIEGYFKKRSCKIRGREGEVLAAISPKKANTSVALGDDVFSLAVQPGVSAELMVAFIVVMDRIC